MPSLLKLVIVGVLFKLLDKCPFREIGKNRMLGKKIFNFSVLPGLEVDPCVRIFTKLSKLIKKVFNPRTFCCEEFVFK